MPPSHTHVTSGLAQAAEAIRSADALLIAAGAGMGVDSGLPDFRGTEGFWREYPPFAALGLRFEDLANEALFHEDPTLAWGFYGHRLNLYRNAVPHAGFGLLRAWSERARLGGFVFTSNVDGQFQSAGFGAEQVIECHGSIHHVQHVGRDDGEIWSSAELQVEVERTTFRARPPLPEREGRLLRPNILMFGDAGWNAGRTRYQLQHYRRWLASVSAGRLVVIEVGAGTAVPTVRRESERLTRHRGAALVRINPREPGGPPGTISLALPAHIALQAIEALLI